MRLFLRHMREVLCDRFKGVQSVDNFLFQKKSCISIFGGRSYLRIAHRTGRAQDPSPASIGSSPRLELPSSRKIAIGREIEKQSRLGAREDTDDPCLGSNFLRQRHQVILRHDPIHGIGIQPIEHEQRVTGSVRASDDGFAESDCAARGSGAGFDRKKR